MNIPGLFKFCLLSSVLITACRKDIPAGKVNDNAKLNAAANTTPAIYYVSPAGNDNNNGLSIATAWKTIAKVNAQIFVPGDQVLFEGGKTFTGTLTVNSSGTPPLYIKFASYGTGKALINGSTGTGIYIYNHSNIWIYNLVVNGSWNSTTQTGNTGYGILFYNDLPNAVKLGTAYISSCDISGFKNAGISFMSYPADGSQSGYNKIVASYNNVHDNGAVGITTLGPTATAGSTAYAFPNVYLAKNNVYNNLGIKSNTSSHSGDGIIIGDASYGVIEKNVAYNNGWYNASVAGGPAAIWCYDSKNITFQYNEAHHNGTGAGKADGDGFDLDGGTTNCIMQYNYSHDNYAAGFLVWEYGNTRVSNAGNIIRYNISQNDNTNNFFYSGITIGSKCNNNLIYNNTVYSSKGSSVCIYGGINNKLYNNIFYATQNNAPIINATVNTCWFFNNDYYNPAGFKVKLNGITYASLAAFRATGNEKSNNINYGYSVSPLLNNPGNGGSINSGNPAVLNSYLLKAASPMINAGYDLTLWGINTGTTDFKINSIPFNGAYDIGACEFHQP